MGRARKATKKERKKEREEERKRETRKTEFKKSNLKIERNERKITKVCSSENHYFHRFNASEIHGALANHKPTGSVTSIDSLLRLHLFLLLLLLLLLLDYLDHLGHLLFRLKNY